MERDYLYISRRFYLLCAAPPPLNPQNLQNLFLLRTYAAENQLFLQIDSPDLLTERKYGVGSDGEFIDAHFKEGLRDGEITAEFPTHADPDAGFVCIFYRHLDEL